MWAQKSTPHEEKFKIDLLVDEEKLKIDLLVDLLCDHVNTLEVDLLLTCC